MNSQEKKNVANKTKNEKKKIYDEEAVSITLDVNSFLHIAEYQFHYSGWTKEMPKRKSERKKKATSSYFLRIQYFKQCKSGKYDIYNNGWIGLRLFTPSFVFSLPGVLRNCYSKRFIMIWPIHGQNRMWREAPKKHIHSEMHNVR